jgi:hypothetical protein
MNEFERNCGNRNGMAVRKLVVCLVALAALALPPALRADDDAGQAARAVRLSSVDGQVQISKGNQVLTDGAVANTPLFEGTRVTTGQDGRAEIQFEDGSVARLSPNSTLTISVLRGSGANGEAVIALEGGLGYFELQNTLESGTMSVKFGDSVATASGFTVLRIDMDNPPGALAVFSGNAHLERGSATTEDLHGGESVSLSANDESRYTVNESIEPDSWDSWNSDRDQAMTSDSAARTGATQNYGQGSNPAWNDLDANGNWYDVPGQGQVWSPYDASNPGWDPYGNGNWGYSPGYGYTWISGNPWGYIPYQCGLWNWYDNFGWGWAPGLGGCNPWWFGGMGYYGPNVGRGYGGYRPPLRPHPPRAPLRGTGLIAVNRRVVPGPGTLPQRDKTSVVQIAGYTVQPMRPLSPRPSYDRSTSEFVNGTVVTHVGSVPATGQGRPAGPAFGATRPGTSTAVGARPTPVVPRSAPNAPRSAPAPSRAPSGGGGYSGGGAAPPAPHAGGGGAHH